MTSLSNREVAYIGLGSNTGDRLAALSDAAHALEAIGRTNVEAVSPVYATEAHGLAGQAPQPEHLNAVVKLRTSLAPAALLEQLQAIERKAGRDPQAPRWSPRPLDLDLLLYGSLILEAPSLIVPHPRLWERRFVLCPLAELAPDLQVPRTGSSVASLLERCIDTAGVEQTSFVLC